MRKLTSFYRVASLGTALALGTACQAAPSASRNTAPASQPTDEAATAVFDAKAFRKPSEAELKRRLTPLQFEVTQREGTERPFDNPYWNNKTDGVYVDIVSGEPLFSSRDKFASGTGWPSFTRPIDPAYIVQRRDASLGMVRVEVRSKHADSHLGHLFDDGPAPTGLRYCINSASLRFVPRDKPAK